MREECVSKNLQALFPFQDLGDTSFTIVLRLFCDLEEFIRQ